MVGGYQSGSKQGPKKLSWKPITLEEQPNLQQMSVFSPKQV